MDIADKLMAMATVVVMLYAVWWGMDKSFAMGRTLGQIESCRGPVPKAMEASR